jgi:hypothetical protein
MNKAARFAVERKAGHGVRPFLYPSKRRQVHDANKKADANADIRIGMNAHRHVALLTRQASPTFC